ncbi:MAG: superfamily II RNA helicase, partial [Planctomycetota bacterium]
MQFRGYELYPFQAEAIEAVEGGSSVIVSAPTGAGKTIVAEYAIEQSIQRNRRVVYTSPIKALSNQKYREFKERYGDKVGIMTGDVTINSDALVMVMTTEIFRNTIFEDESRLHGIDWLIFDEVHYLGDPDRGSVWEESIIFAPPNVRFIALSATVGNLEELQNWMSKVRETKVEMVHTDERPVPQHKLLFLEKDGIFEVKDLKENLGRAKDEHKEERKKKGKGRPNRHHQPRGHDVVRLLVKDKKTPILYFCFSRKKCEQLAQRYQRLPSLLTREEENTIGDKFDELVTKYSVADHPACKNMRHGVTRGILYHHAGVLPIFKDVIERLFTTGLIKILFATETFALGVNMPARCVIFDSLSKYNGIEVVPLRPLDYRQMAGRAGRQGIDEAGDVVAILNPSFDTPKGVREILHRKPGDVVSQFLLGYSTTLHLIRLMGSD